MDEKQLQELIGQVNACFSKKSRDPARIDAILTALGQYWRAHPDTRLGQLVCCMARGADPFVLEDDLLLERLNEALAEDAAGGN
ncbi:MAG: hypothetical protein IJ484_00350 [Oscillospiraceae bacterium]|nr:hypothetical protein [Oscillospiraceae bacterium]